MNETPSVEPVPSFEGGKVYDLETVSYSELELLIALVKGHRGLKQVTKCQ